MGAKVFRILEELFPDRTDFYKNILLKLYARCGAFDKILEHYDHSKLNTEIQNSQCLEYFLIANFVENTEHVQDILNCFENLKPQRIDEVKKIIFY